MMQIETDQPETCTGVGGRLERLVMRFEAMAEAREKVALKRRMNRDSEDSASIIGAESAAAAYRRCADEVQRVANGEEPSDPGMLWD